MSESDIEIRRKVRAIAQKAADDLRGQGRRVPDHTQAILDDLDAVLGSKPVNSQRQQALERLYSALKINIKAQDNKSWREVLKAIKQVEESGE